MSRFAVRLTFVSALLLAALPVAIAHADSTRMVGPYRVTVSFASTPVYPEEANALLIQVAEADGAPVSGLEDSLRLRVGIPNQVTETMPVSPEPDRPGAYRVDLLLPRAAPYTFNLLGTINGVPVDEKFLTERDLDKVIVRGQVYPKGAGLVVLFTLGVYLAGLGILLTRAALRRRKPHRASPASP